MLLLNCFHILLLGPHCKSLSQRDVISIFSWWKTTYIFNGSRNIMYFPLEKLNYGKNGSWLTAPKAGSAQQLLLPRQVRQNQDYLGLGFIQNIVSIVSFTLVAVDCSGNQTVSGRKKNKIKTKRLYFQFWLLTTRVQCCALHGLPSVYSKRKDWILATNPGHTFT